MSGAFAEERRERKDVAVPPPQPVPGQIKVERGHDAIVPLRIYGQSNQALTFVVRKLPRAGRLSELKSTSANTATVRYRPPDDHTVHRDVFEYAVKSFEGVSAAVAVQIEITDQPPELAGPAEVLFPPRLVGTEETQTIELINRGGMTAEGECRVEKPWRLESPSSYRVDPGGRLFAKVTFEPEKAGDFLGELRLSSQPDRAVILRGIAQDGLAVKPAQLPLATDATTLVRAGVFELTNNTPAEQIVRVATDSRVIVERELRLAAGQTLPVMVRTAAEDADALKAEVTLAAGALHARVEVSAGALPAAIRAVERTIDLGLVPGGTLSTGQLTLRNAGGSTGWATVSVQPPFRVPPQRIDIAPGRTAQVPITLDAADVGAAEQAVQVRTASGTFAVPVRAIVTAPGSTPPRLAHSMPELPNANAVPLSTPMPASVHDFEPGRADAKQIVRPVLSEPTRCILEWRAELSGAPAFIAERRELLMQGGQLFAKWEAFPSFRIERTGPTVRGIFENLRPSHRYTVRVLESGPETRRGAQVFQTSFDTPLGKSARTRSSLLATLGVLLACAAGAVAWRWRRSTPSKPARVLKKTERLV